MDDPRRAVCRNHDDLKKPTIVGGADDEDLRVAVTLDLAIDPGMPNRVANVGIADAVLSGARPDLHIVKLVSTTDIQSVNFMLTVGGYGQVPAGLSPRRPTTQRAVSPRSLLGTYGSSAPLLFEALDDF